MTANIRIRNEGRFSPAMRELKIEGDAVDAAKKAGFWTRKVGWVSRKGAPDRLFMHPVRGAVWIEFKRPGEEPEILQSNEHERMRACGLEVHVVDNLEDAMRILGIHPDDNWIALI